MKKINSIGYGHYILLVIILFLLIVPVAAWLGSWLFNAHLLLLIAKISLAAGVLLALAFIIFLAIESRQDRKMNHYYEKRKNVRLVVRGGFECSNCGNNNIRSADKSCGVCGVRFRDR